VSLKDELNELGGDITTALDDMPLASALLDRDGVMRWQNGASRELGGDLIGRRLEELVARSDLEQLHEIFTSTLCHGEPAEFTLHVRDASGAFIPVDFSSAPVRDGSTVVGVFGIGRPSGKAPAVRQAAGETSDLTPRQLEVLQLLGQGQSTHQIAEALSLSPTTVRNYVAQLLPALGVHTRLQAVVEAKQRGLID
jgi:PAS domain S-box-containing protein